MKDTKVALLTARREGMTDDEPQCVVGERSGMDVGCWIRSGMTPFLYPRLVV